MQADMAHGEANQDCFASTLDPLPQHGLFRVHVRGFSEPELGILVQPLSYITY